MSYLDWVDKYIDIIKPTHLLINFLHDQANERAI